MNKVDKILAKNYKKFLIELIKNGDFIRSLHDDYTSHDIWYKIDTETVYVDINFKKNRIKITSDFTYNITYSISNSIFKFFNKTDFELYKQLKQLSDIASNNDIQEEINKVNNLIPIKYKRLDKLNNLMK